MLLTAAWSSILPERLGWPLRDWLPAVVLLFAYWQAGWFFTGPNPGLQQFLGGIDHCIRTALGKWARPFGSGWVGRYFELTYVAAYPLVPLGLATLYLFRYDDYADYFWSVVLPASYICYLMLPFAPTLPPRLERTGDSDTSGVDTAGRRLNLRILGNLGVGANTFPSGHVAATSATAAGCRGVRARRRASLFVDRIEHRRGRRCPALPLPGQLGTGAPRSVDRLDCRFVRCPRSGPPRQAAGG